MSELDDLKGSLRDARARFAALVESIRPDLHRYCSRMTGSALDGEDIVQETLAAGLYQLGQLSSELPLRPWLFTIAHHKCVDFLRSRKGQPVPMSDEGDEAVVEIEPEIEERDYASYAFSRFGSPIAAARTRCSRAEGSSGSLPPRGREDPRHVGRRSEGGA